MEEQLISFETAQLAKEKGFILGIGWHGVDGKFYYKGQLTDNHRGDNPCAPTQSLLQKWLRDVHKIIVLVYLFDEDREDYFSFKIVRRRNTLRVDYPYKSYEEALEKALQEALKLIK